MVSRWKPLFNLSYYTMVCTSTPQFCASCHEIQPAYNEWKASTHVNNAQGFVADCMDCHLPAPHDTLDFFYAKTFHGIKDLIKHFTIDEYNREKNRQAANATFKNAQCLKCHRNLLSMPNSRKPAKAKLTELYEKGLLDKSKFFDERLEVEYDELWHHEGRRARFGAAMMAPDYAWWHGFYECKKRFANYMEEANELIRHNKKAYKAEDWPNATGDTTKPAVIFGKQN